METGGKCIVTPDGVAVYKCQKLINILLDIIISTFE